jgi:pimeloyl-ACP methyl ester carboxylesterase
MPPEIDATDEILTTDGSRRIGWCARGPIDGTPVVYLHGWPGSRLEQRVIPREALERFGVRLLSVDRPGWGNTDKLHAKRSAKALDVLAVCDTLGIERFSVIAFSAGGSHALTLAAVAAGRVTPVATASTQVPDDAEEAEGAVLFRAGRTPTLEAAREERRRAILRDPVGGYERTVPSFSPSERAWYHQPWVRDVYEANMQEAFRTGIEGDIEDCLTRVEPLDADLSTIACPVRAVHGAADDWTTLTQLNGVLAPIADSDVVILDGMKHFGPLLFPDLLLSLACGSSVSREMRA